MSVCASRAALQKCLLTKTAPLHDSMPAARELGPQGSKAREPARCRLRLPCYASRFPPLKRHSLHHHHSLPRHHRHHHSPPIHHAGESDTHQHHFCSCSNRAASSASSEQVACLHNTLTARGAHSDELVVAHWVGGLRRDRAASKHLRGHINRRVTRAHRHCYQAAHT
jgi:hypothetical protein